MLYHVISYHFPISPQWSDQGPAVSRSNALRCWHPQPIPWTQGLPKVSIIYIYISIYIYIYKVCTFEGTISRNPSCFLGLQTKVSYDFLYIFVYFPWSQSIVCCNSGIISAASRWFWCCTECSSTLLAGKLLPVWAPWKKRTHTQKHTFE